MGYFVICGEKYTCIVDGERRQLPTRAITLKNLIPNPSFERDSDWSGIAYDSTQHKYGNRSSRLSGSTVNAAPMPTPTVGHIYYGRNEIYSAGLDIAPADCRFEWYAADAVGSDFVFAWNNGTHADWTVRSSRIAMEVVNPGSYICRNFTVNAQNPAYTDGLMIVDLTEAFGAGNEPAQEWCDQNIPFFEGEFTMEVLGL